MARFLPLSRSRRYYQKPSMKSSDSHNLGLRSIPTHLGNPMVFIGVSLVAIIAAFVLANSGYDFEIKTKAFSAIIVVFLMFCAIVFVSREEYITWFEGGRTAKVSEFEISQKLFAIEEAATYFGGSLKPTDMFRLMCSRIRDLVAFDSCALFMIDKAAVQMRVVQADGDGAEFLRGIVTDLQIGLAASSVSSGSVQIDHGLKAQSPSIPDDVIREFRSAAALPLKRNGEVFAVLKLFSRSKTAFDENSKNLLESICERVTPMVLGSLSFEQSLSNALTDPVTDLPNERAFFMIVENQLAESQRNREGRPLSLLAVDIKYFADINQRFGHATGDRILNFVAQRIKDELRQMDFFARSTNDEFLVILPTATEKVAVEIIARIHTRFVDCKYSVNDLQSVQIDLNFGFATFWKDGETAHTLLAAARERKDQSKTVIPNKVVWFPKEYIN